MSLFNTVKSYEKTLYNNSSSDFIPIVCHYDHNTILTKNGELIQVIQINGINSANVSDQLFNLRQMVRNSIQKNVDTYDFAFWIHTVRRKTNLDDNAQYLNLLSANIHDIWCLKNYWRDKFVNTLYISIVYAGPSTKINNINAFSTSLSNSVVIDFYEKYHAYAFGQLNKAVEGILSDLSSYGATRLGIRFEGDLCYSDSMFLYNRIVDLREDECLLPITDLSIALASNKYAVGSDKIEVIDEDTKKFASILSIKEYHEVSSEALDLFLQLPVELIATEIFFFVDQKKVTNFFQEQNYILKVSGDNELLAIKESEQMSQISNTQNTSNTKSLIKQYNEGGAKYIDNTRALTEEIMFKNGTWYKQNYCNQQISIMIIGDSIKKLDIDIAHTSRELSKLGIMHVKEDINLEQTFWAQLPGNFNFVRRLAPTTLNNTAAIASLHNFPTGTKKSIWGHAVTILRTEKGTPYFFNFHDESNKGHTCIFGINKSGKTTTMNFLLSEATKFQPKICYITTDSDSHVFVEALGGKWVIGNIEDQIQNTNNKCLLNPLATLATPLINQDQEPQSQKCIFEFLKIICNHYIEPLTIEEISVINDLSNKILQLENVNRNLSFIINSLDIADTSQALIKQKLESAQKHPFYSQIFSDEHSLNTEDSEILGFNLHQLLITELTSDVQIAESIKVAALYAISYHFSVCDISSSVLDPNHSMKPKILAIDGLETCINYKYFSETLLLIAEIMSYANGIMVSTSDLSNLHMESHMESHMEDLTKWNQWIDSLNTKLILAPDSFSEKFSNLLMLNKHEFEKLSSFSQSSHMFLIKQNKQSIAVELSITALKGVTKILSSGTKELELYKQIKAQHQDNHKLWVQKLYEEYTNL